MLTSKKIYGSVIMKKVVVITGGSGGIGAATAQLACKQGYAVCIHYHEHAEKAFELCNVLQADGGEVIAVKADIRLEKDVTFLFSQTEKKLGKASALVNNAGIIAPISRLEDMDKSRIQNMFDVNVLGSFLCAKEAIKIMAAKHGGAGGAIVNVSSIAASLGSANEFIDYAATKGAIDSFTVGLAKEVAEEGIRVNAVRPGLIDTRMHEYTGIADRPEKLKHLIPMKRGGRAEEVAHAIMWLLSEEASYVTGTLLDVSGGR